MNKTTQHIGQLSGKVLVFGGVYSNYQALQTLMNIADEANILPSNIICTGDIVAYCAEPEASVQAIRNWSIHSILGNVEIQLRDDLEDCGCNFNDGSRCDVFSRQWFPYAQEQVSDASKKWFHSLPDHIEFDYAGKKIAVVHGNAFETSGFVFKSTDWEQKQKNFDQLGVDIILGGHCGLPFSDVQNGQYWLNAGVIGMPANDAQTHVWYMILDDAPFSFEHYSFEYDYKKAFDLMQKKHLPAQYAKTLQTGLWDNCEILPKKETEAQGEPIF
ncbi:MAG: metallophosphoesterase family protein [Saprospiraceae bacterium]